MAGVASILFAMFVHVQSSSVPGTRLFPAQFSPPTNRCFKKMIGEKATRNCAGKTETAGQAMKRHHDRVRLVESLTVEPHHGSLRFRIVLLLLLLPVRMFQRMSLKFLLVVCLL
jgi:hypothetical protein